MRAWVAGLCAVLGCSSSESAAPMADAGVEASTDVADAIAISFERVAGSNAFRAIVTSSSPVTITSARGSVSAVSASGDGTYVATVTPDAIGSGVYAVTATNSSSSAARSALILDTVDERWGQPEPVRGLVNTPGWEDSVGITPDGEWLFLEYLPVPIDCLIFHLMDPSNPICSKARAPVTGPERPGMPGASRVAADGTIHNGCPSVGLDPAPFAVPPQSLFGFHRQSDGSFAEPFAITVDGIDGCVSAFGPSPFSVTGTAAKLLFSLDDPTDGDPPTGTQADLFVREITLGKPIALAHLSAGKFVPDGTLLGFPPAGHTGNPSQALASDGSVRAVFFDDETSGEQDLFVREMTGSFPAGPYGEAIKLPSAISGAGTPEIQPSFDGTDLFFRRDSEILSSKWEGGSYATSWAAPKVDLAGGKSKGTGAVRTIGEPNVAVHGGKRILYFVYAIEAADGTLDLEVGSVEAR